MLNCADYTNNDNAFGMQTYSQIYNTSYAFWGGASTLNYTSPVRGFPHSHISCMLAATVPVH